MKLLVCLSIMVFVSLAEAGTEIHPRGCIYVHGKCYKECEEGTHGYLVECGKVVPEPTCKNPNPVAEESNNKTCVFSSCYCDPPTVRHWATDKCVKLEDCAKLDQEHKGEPIPKSEQEKPKE